MILDSTTKRIRAYLGGVVTTNQPHYISSWIDHAVAGDTPGNKTGTLNNTTPVEIVEAPGPSQQREPRQITIFNTDTVAVTVTVEHFDGTNQRKWVIAQLNPDWSLEWEADGTWHVYNDSGILQTGGGGGGDTHNSTLHSGNIIPNAVQDFGNNVYSLGTAAEPSASAGRLVFYGFNQNGKTRFGMVTPDGSQITHAQDAFIIARNTSGGTIAAGKAVYVTGSTGQTPNISPAKADALATMPAIGVTSDSIDDNQFGRIQISGIADKLNTIGFTEGDRLWVSASTAGDLTVTEPAYPNLRQRLAVVINVHGSQGKLLILNTGARGEFGIQAVSAGTTQFTSGGAVFADSNGVSFGVNGNTVTASIATSLSNIRLSAGTTSNLVSAFTFADSNNVSFGLNNGIVTASATAHATNVGIRYLGTSKSLDNLITGTQSPGWLSGGAVTDAGGGTIDVAAGDGLLREADSYQATLHFVSWAALTGQSVPTNTTRYVVVFYNSGSPVVQILTSNPTDRNRYIYLAEVHNIAGTLYIHQDPRPAGAGLSRIQNWVRGIIGTRVVSGNVVSDATPPSRKIVVTGGNFWDIHFLEYTTSTVDTSGAGTATSYYRDGSGDWVRTTGLTQWPNSHYDDGTGTLHAITAGYYANIWVIRGFLGDIIFQYGQNEFATVEGAYKEPFPARPEEFDEHGFFVAQITFQESDTEPNKIIDRRPIVGAGDDAREGVGRGDGGNIIAVQGQTAASFGTVLFSNANGVSFGLDSGTLTATVRTDYQSAGAYLSNIRVSAGTTSNLLSALTFSDANGVSFGLNASTVTATVKTDYLTTQTVQSVGLYASSQTTGQSSSSTYDARSITLRGAGIVSVGNSGGEFIISATGGGGGLTNIRVSAGTTSNLLSDLTFANGGGVSFGLNASTLTATVATSLTNVNLSAGTTSNNLSAFVFSNSNNVSFGLNGSTVTATATVATSLSNIRLSAGTTSNLASAFTFADGGGVSFGLNASTITATINTSLTNVRVSAGTTSNLLSAITFSNSNGVSFGLNASTLTASHNGITSQSNQQMTMFATGNTTLSSTGTSNASSLIFRGSGAASVGITNGSVLVDVAAGAAAITQSIGISTQTAGGATAGTSGYATGDDVLYHFVPGSNITMSQSLNGASATLSIYGPAAGGGKTYDRFAPFDEAVLVTGTLGNGSMWMVPQLWPNVQFDRVMFRLNYSNTTNSTGTGTITFGMGFYTRLNPNTLSLYASTTGTRTYDFAGTGGNFSLFGGQRAVSIPWTTTISNDEYVVGVVFSTATAGANASISHYVQSQVNTTFSGEFGFASASTAQRRLGQGIWTGVGTTYPATIAFSHIRGNSSAFQRPPTFFFLSQSTT